MSIGNLKDSGNQGNNFPYQLKVLQGLSKGIDINLSANLTEYYIEEGSPAGLTGSIQVLLDTYPTAYLVSKSIVVTEAGDYKAFITLATL